MSELPDELLSYIAGYHPPSHPIHFVVRESRSFGGDDSSSRDEGDGSCCQEEDSHSLSGGGIPTVEIEDEGQHHKWYKTFSEEGPTKDKHSPNSPMVSKDANPAFDESDEGDYDIALDVLRSLTAEDKSIKLFEEKGPPEIDIDPAPVNNILATSESIGITSVPSGEHFNSTSPAVSHQGSPMLPKRRNNKAQSRAETAAAKASINTVGPPKARITHRKGKKPSLSKSKKAFSRQRKNGNKSIHHSDRCMAGRTTTLREAFHRNELDPTKTILCAKGNQNRTHVWNQDRLRFMRSRLTLYIELRERNAGNMEIAAFNQQAFRDFMGEDSKRTFLGLDERGEWRRLTAKEARGKLAQCFRDEWREWNKRT